MTWPYSWQEKYLGPLIASNAGGLCGLSPALLSVFDVVEVEVGGVTEVAVLCVRCCSATPALPLRHPSAPDDLGPSGQFHLLGSSRFGKIRLRDVLHSFQTWHVAA